MRASLLLILSALLAIPAVAQKPPAPRTLIRAGHLLDVHTGKITDNQTIIVTGDTITAIAPTATTMGYTVDTVIRRSAT